MASNLVAMIQFVEQNPVTILNDIIARYEQATGRTLQPADPEMLVLDAIAYRAALNAAAVNHTGNQNLLRFSTGSALEEIGFLFGITRLPAAPASVLLEYTMSAGHPGTVIPAGNRIQTTDGKATFQTTEQVIVQSEVFNVSISAECLTDGTQGNGYLPGSVSVMLDPVAFVMSAVNTDTTAGAADTETDEELRERIALAPSTFSVAGPEDAYRFFAKSASPAIVDVAVTNPVPGQVNIYPLMAGGALPNPAILQEVQNRCSGDKVRPLTDTVMTLPPVRIQYSITVALILRKNGVAARAIAETSALLGKYRSTRLETLGLDVVREQIIALCMTQDVYKCILSIPSADIIALPEEYTECTNITVTVTGIADE